jgi:hypothetical protein
MNQNTHAVLSSIASSMLLDAKRGAPVKRIGDTVFSRLGCPYVDAINGVIVLPADPEEDVVELAEYYKVILRAAATHHDGSSINITPLLNGIFRCSLMPCLISDEDSAYTLAISLLLFLEADGNSRLSRILHSDTEMAVCSIISAWTSPDEPMTELPEPAVLVSLLFGDAWLLVGEAADLIATKQRRISVLHSIIAELRPAFLPGLCAEQDQLSGLTLPEMGAFP